MAKSIALSRTTSRIESLVAVFLSLLIPVAAAGGSAFAEMTASIIR